MTQRPNLADVAWTMLTTATQVYQDSPRASHWLLRCLERLAEPLRIGVAGGAGVGKSTVVNALAGDLIAPIESGDGASLFAWYRDGAEPGAAVCPPNGPARVVPVARRDRALHIDLRQWQSNQIERVLVDWPSRGLRDIVLIDTPPTTGADWLAAQVDAIVYLTRDPDEADFDLLRSTQEVAGDAAGGPVTTIMVLARADELGAGRIDALSSAKQIARRRRSDTTVHAVCQNVVAVAGLLAQAGRTLREDEFTALRALAGIPRPELDAFLLSADRFAGGDLPVDLPSQARVALLDRFGVFGIRLASTLVRRGADSHAALAGQLVQRSGVSELRESIGRYFGDRSDVLRARAALRGLGVVLRSDPRPQARKLAADAERAVTSTHDFQELRLLAALEAGRITLPGALGAAAERLVGGGGVGMAERLGLDGESDESDLRNAVFDELGQWRAQAESPLLGAGQRAAARTVVRSCEGMLADLTPAPVYH
jgi:hypothetical protein